MSKLPSLYGQLFMDYKASPVEEMEWHLTPHYLDSLASARKNLQASKKKGICCFCGFPEDARFIELHHKNGNHQDYSQGNVLFACSLCHRLNHLGWLGIKNLGDLVYIPSFSESIARNKRQGIGNAQFNLEPFMLIQRFWLSRQKSLTEKERVKIRNNPVFSEIESIITKIKKTSPILTDDAKLAGLSHDNSFNFDIHVLDFLSALEQAEPEAKKQFLATQKTGENGKMCIMYNENIFKPFEPEPTYTQEERLLYYKQKGYFTVDGLSSIMHSLRK